MENAVLLFAKRVESAIDSGAVTSLESLHSFKLSLSRQMHLSQLPTNPDVLALMSSPSVRVRTLLGIKPVRTASGVTPLAVMTKPIDCKHGTCIYCPGGEKSVFGSVPKSYTGNEPASMRAISNSFDAFLQVFNRLHQFVSTGHSVQKIELILMGGTFPSFDSDYQYEFVRDIYWALNTFSDWFFPNATFDEAAFARFFGARENESASEAAARVQSELRAFKQTVPPTLSQLQFQNESAYCRMVTFCIETKPDYSLSPHIDAMLAQGCTRVELGIQSLSEKIIAFSNRGHSISDSIAATQLLKDSAFKVTYHMMPGLPLSTPKSDIAEFKDLFENPSWRPDALKIYPCMVMPGTPLFSLFERGEFSPMDTQTAVEVLARSKAFFPKWVRVQRVMRDIPTKLSIGGVRSNNLRQLVQARCVELGISCQCIRCREVGHAKNKSDADLGRKRIAVETYAASNGTEVFIAMEDPVSDVLFGFCRLRIPGSFNRPEIDDTTALVRELHVFGPAQELGRQSAASVQHRGLGHELLSTAQELAHDQFGKQQLLVIAAPGARPYYKKAGYDSKGAYMHKWLE